jgi:hypothetical protein
VVGAEDAEASAAAVSDEVVPLVVDCVVASAELSPSSDEQPVRLIPRAQTGTARTAAVFREKRTGTFHDATKSIRTLCKAV